MTTQAKANRRKNQAEFWNDKQARATTPEQRVAVWFDACRMLARNAVKNGRPGLDDALAKHLHDFFQHHNG
ncbi:hypothetical protein [Streptomyces sp. NPDC058297]|uniref:hypothetical protein n=1 Tax=Streptomyces sp. NPDC058297 TaxID=3346433 RepID=UPI0036E3C2F1